MEHTKKYFGEQYQALVNFYRYIMYCCTKLKDFDTADQYSLKTLELLKLHNGDDPKVIAEFHTNLGSLLKGRGKLLEAENEYQKALEIRK